MATAKISKAKAPVKAPVKASGRRPRKADRQIEISADDVKALVIKSLEDDKAEEIVIIPLAGRSALADYMVIASGRSTRQVAAMAEHLRVAIGKTGHRARVEGAAEANWVVVDSPDVIVHLFRPEVRAFYNLEKMWLVDIDEASLPKRH